MKAIFFKVTLCVSALAIAGVLWVKVQSTDTLSDIQLANIGNYSGIKSY